MNWGGEMKASGYQNRAALSAIVAGPARAVRQVERVFDGVRVPRGSDLGDKVGSSRVKVSKVMGERRARRSGFEGRGTIRFNGEGEGAIGERWGGKVSIEAITPTPASWLHLRLG